MICPEARNVIQYVMICIQLLFCRAVVEISIVNVRGCLHEKTRIGASFKLGGLFDFV